jgi:hypothetical protein
MSISVGSPTKYTTQQQESIWRPVNTLYDADVHPYHRVQGKESKSDDFIKEVEGFVGGLSSKKTKMEKRKQALEIVNAMKESDDIDFYLADALDNYMASAMEHNGINKLSYLHRVDYRRHGKE